MIEAPRMTAARVKAELKKHASTKDATFLSSFFRAGPGEYGEGDRFLGIRVPATRKVAKAFADLDLSEVQVLLDSEFHEHRLAALHVLGYAFPKASPAVQKKIHDLYIRNVRRGRVNNWDLVDSSAGPLAGAYLLDRPRDLLFELAKSKDLWSRRVAIVATMEFLKANDATTTIEIATRLRHDSHDLMHKAVGWLLREMGKRVDRGLLRKWLKEHAHDIPRTMLRYAIEHFPPEERRMYMDAKNAGTARMLLRRAARGG